MQVCLKSGEDYPPDLKLGGSIPFIPRGSDTTDMLITLLHFAGGSKGAS